MNFQSVTQAYLGKENQSSPTGFEPVTFPLIVRMSSIADKLSFQWPHVIRLHPHTSKVRSTSIPVKYMAQTCHFGGHT